LARIVAGDIERPFARPVSRLRAGRLLGLAKFFRKKKSEEAARDRAASSNKEREYRR
jgi:hypothetical protein